MKRFTLYAAIGTLVFAAFSLRISYLTNIPPGLFYDEASDGLDALRVARGDQFPIFFEANGGREPLFNYGQAIAIWLFGIRGFSLRIVAVFAGVITIPVVFQLARQLSAGQKRADLIALLTAGGVAVSFWHLNFSRLGQRAILLPLVASLTFYYFWRARGGGRSRDWLASGAFLGIGLYTYLSARFLPIVLIAFFVVEIFGRPRALASWIRPRAMLLIVALVVFIPLGIYFLFEPGAFLGRAQDVAFLQSTRPDIAAALASNIGRVAGMFFVRGDLEWRHNLAGRPVLDWIAVVPFIMGAVISLTRWKQSATQFAWIWLIVMLLPSALSQGAPDFARAIGALPVAFLIVAGGWDALLNIVTRFAPRWETAGVFAALALTLFGSGFITTQDYFVRWATNRRTIDDFEGGMTDLANWLNRASTPIYLQLELYAHPTIQFLTATRFGRVTALTDSADLMRTEAWVVVPDPRNTSGAFVVLREGQVVLLDPAPLPRLIAIDSVRGRRGPVAGVARVSGNPFGSGQPTAMTELNSKFENHLTLLGYNLTRSRSDQLEVTLYWRAQQLALREPKVFVHLLNENDVVIAQADELLTGGVSVLDWPIGEMMPDRHVLPLNKDLPSAQYRLEFGLSDLFGSDRINVTLADGTVDDHVLVGPLTPPAP